METRWLVLPVCAHVLLTFVILIRTALLRVRAVAAGQIRVRDIALGQDAWPAPATQASRSFSNQFETPVLFYALAAFVSLLDLTDRAFVILAWLFVGFRILHAIEHLGRNNVRRRLLLFAIAVTLLLAQWVYLAVRIFA